MPRCAGTAHGCHSGHPSPARKCPPPLGFLMERWWDFTKCLLILCRGLLACKGVQEGRKANEGNVFIGLVSWFSFPLCSRSQWLRQRVQEQGEEMEGDELWCCCPSMSLSPRMSVAGEPMEELLVGMGGWKKGPLLERCTQQQQ